jgi:hypothetical protein
MKNQKLEEFFNKPKPEELPGPGIPVFRKILFR